MKLALAAYECRNNDLVFNLRQIEKGMQAARGRAELVCFGEAFLQGFDALRWDYARDLTVAVPTDGEVFRQLKDWTLQYGVDLLLGYLERSGQDLFSSCALLGGGKLLHNYRRISRGWKELRITGEHYREGEDTSPLRYRGRELRIALCGDLWDAPERFAPASLLLWPVYVNYALEEWPEAEQEYAVQAAAAAETTLMVNPLMKEPCSHGGAFVFRAGKTLQRLPLDTEDLLIAEV